MTVQSSESIERKRAAIDRWIDSSAWVDRPAKAVQGAILKFEPRPAICRSSWSVSGDRLNAIAATCSHAGGPLDEGKLEGDIVTCPLHTSRFCVADGAVKDGPATFDQPALLVREENGKVQVRLPAPLH